MNCKPGDLAVIVQTMPETAKALGRFVSLTESVLIGGEACWRYREMPIQGHRWTWIELPDAWLRPIRDPGDDARDETLDWLTVPSKQTESA